MRLARALSIAGNDPTGGAGIQADLKTFSALGVYGLCALTVVVDENTVDVKELHPLPADFVKRQIQTILSDIEVDAIKLGLLYSPELIRATQEALMPHRNPNIVLDPVMVVASGEKFSLDEAAEALIKDLIPLARVVTPNIPEAETLLGEKIENQSCLPEAARKLSSKLGGHVSVLLKAGHLTEPEVIDVFYNAETKKLLSLPSRRIYTTNINGTGCTFASAIAAYLARGECLDQAVIKAKNYLAGAIEEGAQYLLGAEGGTGPVQHFWNVAHWGEVPEKR